jgi:hypothetical protein
VKKETIKDLRIDLLGLADQLYMTATNLRLEANKIKYRDKRIEDLQAALRKIAHAPHGKVFNAHGHEEAYLIACKALEGRNDFAT